MRLGEPNQRPAARHNAVRVVTAATGGQPPAIAMLMGKLVEHRRCRAVRVRGQAQVRQWIEGMRVTAVLSDEERRPEGICQRGHDLLNGRDPRAIAAVRVERNVDGTACGAAAAGLVHEAAAGKERHACLVNGERQDLRVVPEERLRTVAMVHIQVDVQDTVAGIIKIIAS